MDLDRPSFWNVLSTLLSCGQDYCLALGKWTPELCVPWPSSSPQSLWCLGMTLWLFQSCF